MGNETLTQVDPTALSKGTILRLGNFTTITPSKTQLGYNAGKDKVFVAVLLGLETRYSNKSGDVPDEIDIEQALNRMGWYNVEKVDWVECAQFLVNYRYWEGDARDFCRVLPNLKDWGITDEQIAELVGLIDWPSDTKEQAWQKVYLCFKKMYREALDLKTLENELPERFKIKSRSSSARPEKKTKKKK